MPSPSRPTGDLVYTINLDFDAKGRPWEAGHLGFGLFLCVTLSLPVLGVDALTVSERRCRLYVSAWMAELVL